MEDEALLIDCTVNLCVVAGELTMEQTSECSSVYESASWTDYFNDTYFTDKDAAGLSSKNLFTSFRRGTLNGTNKSTTYPPSAVICLPFKTIEKVYSRAKSY